MAQLVKKKKKEACMQDTKITPENCKSHLQQGGHNLPHYVVHLLWMRPTFSPFKSWLIKIKLNGKYHCCCCSWSPPLLKNVSLLGKEKRQKGVNCLQLPSFRILEFLPELGFSLLSFLTI